MFAVMDAKFTWVETHKQLSQKLLEYRDKQEELIRILQEAGVRVPEPVENKIDPLSFYALIYKYGDIRRLAILQSLAQKFKIFSPSDVKGIPSISGQKVLFFDGTIETIERIWELFEKVIRDKDIENEFVAIQNAKNIGSGKLTIGLFYIFPDKFLPIDKWTKKFIEQYGIKAKSKNFSFQEYQEILNQVRLKISKPFYEISYLAWLQKNPNYWIFQGNPKYYDFERAFLENRLTGWQIRQHRDEISKGDKGIIWLTGNKSGIYALVEVISDPYETQEIEDVDLWIKKDQAEKTTLIVDIEITHNLFNSPIRREDLQSNKKLKDLKVGQQGTIFRMEKHQFAEIQKIAEKKLNFKTLISKLNPNDLEKYIITLHKLFEALNLKQGDQRLVFRVLPDQLALLIGKYYFLSIYWTEKGSKFGSTSTRKLSNDCDKFKTSPTTFYCRYEDFSVLQSNWQEIINAAKIILSKTEKSNFQRFSNEEFENYVFNFKSKQQTMNRTFLPSHLNLILYGPPGTGKTYETVRIAAEIVAGRPIEDYNEALQIFNENLHERIEFITFHQNYSYEDFVQGLRPKSEKGNLVFEQRDGIFYQMVINALFEYYKILKQNEIKNNTQPDFDEVYFEFIEYLNDLDNKIFKTATGAEVVFVGISSSNNLRIKPKNGATVYTINKKRLQNLFEQYPDYTKLEKVKDIEKVIGKVPFTFYYVALKALSEFYMKHYSRLQQEDEQNFEDIDYETKKKLLLSIDLNEFKSVLTSYVPKYVLIIDEINRANISRVFGELITLIEPDKRLGGKYTLEILLPSGERFVVPSNLYIIGTLNTADKSIALLDIALRRRFEFRPMYPRYDLPNIYEKEILKRLNEKIIQLKGHDFQIGHSYFMSTNEEDFDFEKQMNEKVIPLLLEYFMNDVQTVLDILNYALEGSIYEVLQDEWPLQIKRK